MPRFSPTPTIYTYSLSSLATQLPRLQLLPGEPLQCGGVRTLQLPHHTVLRGYKFGIILSFFLCLALSASPLNYIYCTVCVVSVGSRHTTYNTQHKHTCQHVSMCPGAVHWSLRISPPPWRSSPSASCTSPSSSVPRLACILLVSWR